MSGELKTLTYVVKMDIGDGKTKAKEFRTTIQTMSQDADKASSGIDKLAKTIGDKYNTKVTTAVDQTRTVQNQIKASAREATRSEKAFAQLSREYTHLASRTGKTADEQEVLNAQYRLGASATKEQREQAALMVKSYQEQRNAANKTQGSMRGLRGQAQNLGWQLQDVAVQAQMGTSALVILGQQGSQLASGFGPKGAVIGAVIAVSAALIGVAGSAAKTKEELKDAEKYIKLIGETANVSADGVTNFGDKITLLARQSRELARIQLTRNIQQQLEVSNAAGKELYQTFKDLSDHDVKKLFDDSVDGDDAAARYSRIGKAITLLTTGVNPDRVWELSKAIELLNVNGNTTTKSAGKLADAALKLISDFEQGQITTKAFKNALGDLDSAIKKAGENTGKSIYDVGTTNFGDDIASLQGFIKTKSKKLDEQFEIDISRAKQAKDLGLATEQDYQDRVVEITQDYAKKKGAIDENYKDNTEKLARERIAIERQATKELNDLLSEQSSMQQKHISTLAKYSDNGKLIQLQIQYEEEKAMLAGNNEALLALDQHYADERTKINGSVWEKMAVQAKESIENTDQLMADSLDRFVSGTADAFGNAIVYSDSFGEAMSNVFKGAISSMLSYFAELAIQQALSWAFTSTGESLAQASAATTMTMNAQAASFMAGINAFSSTAAIPIVGPALAPAASTAAIAATQPLAQAVSSFAFAGVFDKGGMIPSGSAGIVSEFGDELVGGTMVYNGSQGSLGVTGREDTAKKMGGSNTNVNINSYGNASPEAIARAMARQLKKPNKAIDNAIYGSMNRGRKNKGAKFNA